MVGRVAFPLDMLRYDCCYPHRSEDAANIKWVLDYENAEAVTIRLARVHEGREPRLTPDRWRSFGWCIVTDSQRTEKL